MKNNDYTDIRVIEDKICIKIYGIENRTFAILYKLLLLQFKNFMLEEITDPRVIGRAIYIKDILDEEDDVSLDIKVYLRDNDNFITEINNNISDDTLYKLKPEVGYEIINKLKEIFGDDLYEK